MRKRLLTGTLAAFMAVSGIVTTNGNVYAADKNTIICEPDTIENVIESIDDNNKEEKVLLLQPGEYPAIEINKPNVTVKSQNPDKPAVFKGSVIKQEKDLSKKEKEKFRSSMIEISASDVRVENVEVTGLRIEKPGETTPIGIEVSEGADNIYIDNCVVHDMGCTYTKNATSKTGFNAHGIHVKSESEDNSSSNINITDCTLYNLILGNSEALVLNGNVENFVVSGNTVHDCDNIGIDIIGYETVCQDEDDVAPEFTNDRARNGEVKNNHVYNISSATNLTYRDTTKEDPDPCAGAIYVDGGYGVTISDNFVANSDIGIELASEHNGGTTEDITVTNNILVNNNSLGGISIGGSGDTNGVAVDCKIYNNTIYTDSCICFRIQHADHESNKITKNVFIADGKNAVLFKNENGSTQNTVQDNYLTKADGEFKDNKTFKLASKNINIEDKVFEYSYTGADLTGYGAGTKAAAEEPEVTTEEVVEPEVTTEEVTEAEVTTEEVAEPEVITEESAEPEINVTGESKVYTVNYEEDDDDFVIEYKKKSKENWEPVVLSFENVDLSEYSKVNITVVPSRKNMNLGITNMDDDDPKFYRDHWSKKGKFSSTKEQTITIKLDEENVKGFYLYLDATSSDKVDKKTTYTFKITDVDFE